jgi:hypothetical protein
MVNCWVILQFRSQEINMGKRGTAALAIVAIFLPTASRADDKPVVEQGFTSLFNGVDLDGWHIMNKGQFSVRKGVIYLNKGGGWLRTDKQYKDFELRLEFRFIDKGADSGIFVRAGLEGDNWPKKNYQVQTMDNDTICSVFAKMLDKGKEAKDKAKLKKVMKPTGEWQSYVIVFKGKTAEVKLNSETINSVDGLTDEAGYIGLQGEGGQLEFKNIRIKELKE